MVWAMPKSALLGLLLAAAACSNTDNLILNDPNAQAGQTVSGVRWPVVFFGSVNSSFASEIALFDQNGAPTGQRAWVIIMSDQPGLCATLKAKRDYFRNAPGPYQALILFLPTGRLGTFIPGRPGDEGTDSEIVATVATGPTAPFTTFITTSVFNFISLTDWSDGAADGNFNLFYLDPAGLNVYQYQGQFKTSSCDGLDGVLLP
jgi:hypothetical protein